MLKNTVLSPYILKFYTLFLFTLLLAFFSLSINAAPANSPWGKDYFPNIELTTHEGKKVRFYDDMIKGKVVAINFIFTSCGASCPLETARLRKVQKILGDRVGKDIFFYSISIDSKRDTPEVLKAYAEKFKIGKGWKFLTGNEQEIIDLRTKLGLYIQEIQNNPDNPEDHNLSLIIGNEATGRWMKRSPFENPYVLASQLGDWLHNWKKADKKKDSYANAPKLRSISKGEDLFRTRCSACHTIAEGDGMGPDLLGVTQRRDRAWLTRWLKDPEQMIKDKDPIALPMYEKYNQLMMPNLQLQQAEIIELLSYLSGEDTRHQKLKSPKTVKTVAAIKPAAMMKETADKEPSKKVEENDTDASSFINSLSILFERVTQTIFGE
jgi:cytochrome oxidase Cu insertion factor (SCO1/SenC/PrrC family)